MTSCIFQMPDEKLTNEQYSHISRIFLEDKIEKLNNLLHYSHEHYNFNGNILVAQHGKIIFNDHIGYADFHTKDTLSPNSIYQLASLSKQFTSMAVLILKERGNIEFDDKMVQYIPELSGDNHRFYDSITVRHLLNHTSGLPNYMFLVERYLDDDHQPYNDEVVRLIARHKKYLNFEPGRRFQYSNTGYMILALIVERISERRFDAFVRENIFSPLGMDDSFVYSATYKDKGYENKLEGYRKFRSYYRIPETQHDGVVGDKGVFSTAADLYKWDQALYSDTLVPQETLAEAFKPGKLESGRKVPYGFGFRLRKDEEGDKLAYHDGLWNGFRNGIYRYLNDTSTIIILEHTDCEAKGIITRKIRRILQTRQENVTEVLAKKAIADGGKQAVEVYRTLVEMDLEFNVDEEKLRKVYDYLVEIDKLLSARRVRVLIQAVSEKDES